MPATAREIYDEPDKHLSLLTTTQDRDFEGQNFERKEACRPNHNNAIASSDIRNFRKQIAETISAFANANRDDSLFVLGIASDGAIKGLKYLSEEQSNTLLTLNDLLIHCQCQHKLHPITNELGKPDEIALFLISYSASAVCETIGTNPKAWRRSGRQNILLTDVEREQLKRNKGIVNFERTPCTVFNEHSLANDVTKEFADSFHETTTYSWTIEDILNHIGALQKEQNQVKFTNAGTLYFSSNPQRDMPHAYVRVLQFGVSLNNRNERPPPTIDKSFDGPITKQIRDFRTFLKESGFFKYFQKRRSDGGFDQEPELPLITVDEAIVNAVAHRDYAIQIPIYCEKYDDGLIVKSPGTLLQDKQIPNNFSLDQTRLEHLPRNPKIMEWLRQMKDPHGTPFVLALQEGTKKMRDEMAKLGLPAPIYEITNSDTQVILRSDAPRREVEAQGGIEPETTEFTNLYQLSGLVKAPDYQAGKQRRQDILQALSDKLAALNWFVDRFKFGILTAHRRGVSHPAPTKVTNIVRIYPAKIFTVREYFNQTYLVADSTTVVQSVMTVADALVYFKPDELIELSGLADMKGWKRVRIRGIDKEYCRVYVHDYDNEENVPITKVIPRLPRKYIDQALQRANIKYDLSREIKRAGLAMEVGAARRRAENTQTLINELADKVFPLKVQTTNLQLSTKPLELSHYDAKENSLRVDGLIEPEVEFHLHHGADIRDGITRFGSFDHDKKDIDLIPICAADYVKNMRDLIERLQSGKFKYRGTERTFSTKLTYNTVISTNPDETENECKRLLGQSPDWIGAKGLPRIFLVHCPEAGFSLDDENSPYYRIKRYLFQSGVPCQMVDTPTLLNADYKDLNLALNIVAKCGVAPWVLPESISDADFFVGLSYTQSVRSENSRIMGFANVFNEYGRWEFYSGGSSIFSYEDKAKHYEILVEQTLSRLNLSERPTIYFHYSAKFSHDDKQAILRGARKVKPNGTYVFVSINRHHHIRFYDSRVESDGSLARGRYVIGGNNQVYVSTTGYNPYRKVLGTPQTLEINVDIQGPPGTTKPKPDLRAMAGQILSLTKLNWASTDSLCAEPITTKYAGDIAYLTAAFLRQNGEFSLHPVLERSPWFI